MLFLYFIFSHSTASGGHIIVYFSVELSNPHNDPKIKIFKKLVVSL